MSTLVTNDILVVGKGQTADEAMVRTVDQVLLGNRHKPAGSLRVLAFYLLTTTALIWYSQKLQPNLYMLKHKKMNKTFTKKILFIA